MTDREIQKKLNQIAKLAQELDAEAKSRYGNSGQLFLEPESGLYLMENDASDGRSRERQVGIRFRTTLQCPIEAGGW